MTLLSLIIGLILGYLLSGKKGSLINIRFYININFSNNLNGNGNNNGNDNLNNNGNHNGNDNEVKTGELGIRN